MDEARATPIADSSETKGSSQIPHCRDDFTLDEARHFVDELSALLHSLSDLSNLTNLYRAARQLSRTFTMCRDIRSELAQYMNENGVPRILTRLIKRLNNAGVFNNDGTWFSSFYLYSVVWNYSDISERFSTSVGVAGICQLLNLNIGHPPYLENINSKNVYFLVKASLSILHNIIKVPGNRDMGQYMVGRDALLNMINMEGEDSLRCFAVLCLAHVLNEDEIQLANPPKDSQRPNLLQYLLGQMCSASASVKRRNHGLPMLDILTALSVFAVHEPVQPGILSLDVEKVAKPGRPPPAQTIQPVNCLKFLTRLTDVYLSPDSTKETQREANAAIRIIYHILFNQSLASKAKVVSSVKHLLDLSRYPTVLERSDKALSRVLENMIWQTSQPLCPLEWLEYKLPEASQCGPVVMSYSPINNLAVAYFVQQLRAAGIPLWNDTEDVVIDHESAQDTGLSGLAASASDQKGWLQSLNQATVMIVCLSDAYRLNPGCRAELEYFVSANSEAQPKVIIYIVLPPKFRINGWISRMPGINDSIDFTHKRTFINNLQVLVSRAGKPYGITVADEQLEPLSFDFEGQKGYISIEDLQGLKSSSIFLTSSDSEPSRRSVITHTAEQMFSKGSPRFGTPMMPERDSSESTPTHTYESEDHHPADLPPVASVPSMNLSDSLADEPDEKGLLRASTPFSPGSPDVIQEDDKGPAIEDASKLDSESSVPNTRESLSNMEAKQTSAVDKALPATDAVNEDSRQEEISSRRTEDVDTRITEVSDVKSRALSQQVRSEQVDTKGSDASRVKSKSFHQVSEQRSKALGQDVRSEDVETKRTEISQIKTTSTAQIDGARGTEVLHSEHRSMMHVENVSMQDTETKTIYTDAASNLAQNISEAGRSQDIVTKKSDVPRVEAASNLSQAISEAGKSQGALSVKSAAASGSIQAHTDASKSQDVLTRRSDKSREAVSAKSPSATGSVQTHTDASKSQDVVTRKSDTPRVEAASNLSQAISEAGKSRGAMSVKSAAASGSIQAHTDASKSHDVVTRRSDKSREVVSVKSPSATGSVQAHTDGSKSQDVVTRMSDIPRGEAASNLSQAVSEAGKSRDAASVKSPSATGSVQALTEASKSQDVVTRRSDIPPGEAASNLSQVVSESGKSQGVVSTKSPAATGSVQALTDASKSQDVVSRGSDVPQVEAASYMSQAVSEAGKSLKSIVASSVAQSQVDVSRSQDVVTKRSNVDAASSQLHTISEGAESQKRAIDAESEGRQQTQRSEAQSLKLPETDADQEASKLGEITSASTRPTAEDKRSESSPELKQETIVSPTPSNGIFYEPKQTPGPVGERTTHMHMIKEPPRVSPRNTQEDSVETQSATPETLEKQTVSMDLSKTLSSLNARRSTDKRPRAARDSSVQTLSVFPDIKTMRTTEFSMNAPTELDRINPLMMQSHYFPDPLNSMARMLDLNDIVQPYVREWTEDQVDEWLNSKGLPQLSHRLCGHMNGVVLSQLVYLRHWAPEYFAKSVRSELGLGFVEGLRFVEALEELKKKN